MRKIFLVFLLCSSTILAVAQQPTLADQLKKDLAAHPAHDTIHVNKLIEMGLTGVFTLAEREVYMMEALSLSQNLGYRMGEAQALVNLWFYKIQQGDSSAAESLFSKADALVKKSGNDGLKGLLLLRLGQEGVLNNDTSALNTLLKARPLLEREGFYKPLINCLIAIGQRYDLAFSNFPLAMEYYLKALSISETSSFLFEETQILAILGGLYATIGDRNNALVYLKKAADKNKKTGSKALESTIQNNLGENYRLSQAYPEAIQAYNRAIVAAPSPRNVVVALSNLADVYLRMDNLPLAFKYAFEGWNKSIEIKYLSVLPWVQGILARAYLKKSMPDSSIYYAREGLNGGTASGNIEFIRDNSEALANAYAMKQDYRNAYNYHVQFVMYRDSMLNAEVKNKTALLQYNSDLNKKQSEISDLNQQKKAQKNFLISALVVLTLILVTAGLLLRNNRQKQKANTLLQQQKEEIDRKAEELTVQKDNIELLGEIGRKITSSLSVEKIISTAYDSVNKLMDASVFGIGIYHDDLKRIDFPATYENGEALPPYAQSIEDKNRFGSLSFTSGKEIIIGDLDKQYKDHVQEVLTPHAGGQPMSIIFLPLIAKEKKLGVITVQSFEKNAYTDYHLYMLRNIAIYTAIALENADSYDKLNHTVANLKSAQQLLIQSEKMASLGELTAGIAHEIQNPLNFVNNFSEVNKEMIAEMKDAIDRGNFEEVKLIANTIDENQEKINHHGKRADGIVKGMLQHSRTSSGKKEPTEINVLTDEYLRLAYHGLRAKDKSFNATLKTDYDSNVDTINVIPQDIGRVILNLITNAFYAVNEKKNALKNIAGHGYEPTVSVSTKKINDRVEIKVADNGNGIPQDVIDKIFQPFFTTKPTGQGTGLGLSLSYDIVKVHQGELKVNTSETSGTEFKIILPA